MFEIGTLFLNALYNYILPAFATVETNYYHYYAEAVNFDTARSRCESKGFSLAAPKSESENTKMLNAIKRYFVSVYLLLLVIYIYNLGTLSVCLFVCLFAIISAT